MKREEFYALIDAMPGNFMVLEANEHGFTVQHSSCDMEALIGMPLDPKSLQFSITQFVLEDDVPMVERKLSEYHASGRQEPLELLFRTIHKKRGFIWVHLSVKPFGVVEDAFLYLLNIVDVTKETSISYALMGASDRYVCVIERSSKRILYGNDRFFELIHSNAAESVGQHCYKRLCKVMSMKDNNNCLCFSSLNADPPIETYNSETHQTLTITGREVVWGEYDAYVFFMTDITEKKQKEEELRDSNKRFEVALENSELMVWEYDIEHSRCIVSQKASNGYQLPTIIENYPESLYEMGHTPPETVEQIKECKRRLLAGETGFSVERRTINAKGESEWQKVEYTLECDLTGKPIRAIVCGLDITKQKELEAKYKEQMEIRNRYALNSLCTVRFDLEEDQVLDFTANSRRARSMGQSIHTASEFLESLSQTVVFDPKQELRASRFSIRALKEMLDLGQTQIQGTCTYEDHYLNINLSVYRNPGNSHCEVFLILSDVTDSVLKESALSTVAKNGYDFVALVDVHSGKACMVAKSADAGLPELPDGWAIDYDEIIVGFAREHRERYLTEEDYQRVSDGMVLEQIIQKLSETPNYEFSCRAKAGDSIRTYRMRFTYVENSHNYILYTRSNITKAVQEEHAVQEKLEAALQAAKDANQSKTDFLARMSHDMRTPMNAIIGLSALTIDDADQPKTVVENMTKMRASSDFLLGLVNDILDMAKIEDGSVVLDPQPYAYSDFLSNMKTMFLPQCEAKNLTLHFAGYEHNPVVMVDKMRINQIFFNILSNAVKYTLPGGEIDYRLENLEITEDTNVQVDFEISDTGIGMSEEYQKHLFEPFMQENNAATAELQGSGLGLSITKQLVDRMGGTIRIVSKKGVGTSVHLHFAFPLLTMDAETKRTSVALPDNEALLVGKTVLLVEDHPLNAQIAQKLLEKKGMKVMYASNGLAAVELFRASDLDTFDVILMDIRMPEMDGLEATRAIRSLDRPDAQRTPIYAMSANAYAEDIQKSLDAGMNGHLAKPVEPNILYSTLIACFSSSK